MKQDGRELEGLPGAPPKRRRTPRRLQRKGRKPDFQIDQILAWADEYFERKGRWPHHFDGYIPGTDEETWSKVNSALSRGGRGLLGGSSLANLLYRQRGVRSPDNVPLLDEDEIFRWAKAHFKRNGEWPHGPDGAILDAPGETWTAVDLALSRGTRGLPGGSSLAQLFDARGVKHNPQRRPKLTSKQILAWADAFHAAHGYWPYHDSGEIPGSDGDTWSAVDRALTNGRRGLPGGSSLSSLLNEHRGIYEGLSTRPHRIPKERRLHVDEIAAWAKACFRKKGFYPKRDSGKIQETNGETWSAVDTALKSGCRGLPGGSSLAQLLSERFGVRNHMRLPKFTTAQILDWADAYHARTGNWPTRESGPVEPSSEELWSSVDNAVLHGLRGLRQFGSLAQFLAKHRGARNRKALPKLSERKILAWADTYHDRTGKWPTHLSGPIPEAPGETWGGVHGALYVGYRGFPGGDSLHKLLKRYGRRKSRFQDR